MSHTGTAHRCIASEALPPTAVEVACGLLTANPPRPALNESLAQARPLPPSRPILARDAALSAVLDRARLVYPADLPISPGCPGMLADPGVVVVRPEAGGMGRGDSAALIGTVGVGKGPAVDALKAGPFR